MVEYYNFSLTRSKHFSAYFDDEEKRKMRKKGIYNGILDKGKRSHPLTNKQKKKNKQKSRVRNAVERPFAHFKNKWSIVA